MPRVSILSLLCTTAITAACADSAECPPETQRVGSRCLATDDVLTTGTGDPTNGKEPVPGKEGSACLFDQDGDGYGVPSQPPPCTLGVLRGDCDDGDPQAHPGAPEICADGLDNNCDGLMDEPHEETCNGRDDDCDGLIDNGVLTTFYPDQDGDGFGHGQPVHACEAPLGYVPVRGDCDDASQAVQPDVPEICDALDNNCDGQADEAFECVFGSSVRCTTVCGSTGTGTCGSDCSAPTEAACALPDEVCNLQDDNCDGLTDEGLLEPLSYTLHTQRASGVTSVSVTSVPRAEGGAWVLYRPNSREGVQPVNAVGFDAGGHHTGRLGTVAAATEGSGLFAADGDGKWVVIASAKGALGVSPSDPRRSLRVQLFDARSLGLVAEHQFEHTTEPQELTSPYEVSLLEDDRGNVHTLVVYLSSRLTQTGNQKALSPSLRMRALKYTPEALWTETGDRMLSEGMPLAEQVAVTRVPCRDEWLLVQSTGAPASPTVRRVSLAGRFVGAGNLDTLEDARFITGLEAGAPRCAEQDPELVVGFTQTDGASRLRRWIFDRSTGALLRAGDVSLGSTRYHAKLVPWGGRWFVAAATGNAPQTSAPPYLAEVDFDGAPALRPIAVGQGNNAANPGVLYMANVSEPSRLGLVHTGAALLLSVPNSLLASSNLDALHQASAPGSRESALAVSYTIGCP